MSFETGSAPFAAFGGNQRSQRLEIYREAQYVGVASSCCSENCRRPLQRHGLLNNQTLTSHQDDTGFVSVREVDIRRGSQSPHDLAIEISNEFSAESSDGIFRLTVKLYRGLTTDLLV